MLEIVSSPQPFWIPLLKIIGINIVSRRKPVTL